MRSDERNEGSFGAVAGVQAPPSDLAGGPYPPVLDRFPDARPSKIPIFDPLFLGYLAPVLGSTVAAIPALYNAVVLRKLRIAVVAIILGIVGPVAFLLVLGGLSTAGMRNIPLILLGGRVAHLLIGVLLAASQWNYARGVRALRGPVLPLLYCILAGFAINALLPWNIRVSLLGLLPRGR